MDLEQLARETDGFSPADLKALTQEAALSAMSRGEDASPSVTQDDFTEALARLRGRTPAGVA